MLTSIKDPYKYSNLKFNTQSECDSIQRKNKIYKHINNYIYIYSANIMS